MPAVQLIRAERDNDQDAVQGVLVTDQEGQQITRGPVRPVRVLDYHDHRPGPGQVPEQGKYLLEHPRPRLTRIARAAGLAQLGQQPGQVPRAPAGQQRRHAVRA
jgi:hypothetical protein